MRQLALVLAATFVGMASGCASVAQGTSQTVKVEAFDQAGIELKNADCTLTNERGQFRVMTPGAVIIRRSDKDMQVVCQKEGQPDGKGAMVSRVNGGMFGNLIIGGGIGAIVDHSNGSAYTYPEWVQIVMGKLLSFDRTNDSSGKPSVATIEDVRPVSVLQTPAIAPAASPIALPALAQGTSGTYGSAAYAQPLPAPTIGNQGAFGMGTAR